MTEDSKMKPVSALRASVSTGALFRAALLTAGIVAAATPAEAALYYTRDSDPGVYRPSEPPQRARQPQRAHRPPKKQETKVKETTVHPQLPLVISVSISSQRVKIYDANGLFAEAPVSTGMPGHPTPQGVFSVIEKDRYHHSNIYSGAPMPFMQRITWGGVAMHAGVLPGYPASHGCIRMPMDFATKMWGWTKMGARVFVTPAEVPAPTAFSHPFLAAYKVAPQPLVAEPPVDPDAKVGPKADLRAPEIKSIETRLDLRPSVGHDKPADAPATRTADAGSKTSATMTDAGRAAPREETKPIETADAAGAVPARAGETTGEAKPDVAEAAKRDEAAPEQKLADKPAEAKSTEAKSTEVMAPETGAQPVAAAKAEGDDAKPERTASTDVKAEEKPEAKAETKGDLAPKAAEAPKTAEPVKPVEAKSEPKIEAPKAAETPKAEVKPDTVKANVTKPDVAKPDDAKAAKKDETRITPPVKVVKESPRRTGQIAVFISGKDSKLYVRQNFAPLFDVPITIAPGDHPLGTHVFTAQVDKEDSNALHWSVVTVPMSRAHRAEDSRQRVAARGKKRAPPPPPVETKIVVNSPTEALDRITVPPEAMARIAEALGTGGSIIVADQSIKQGETGEYTDFILSLR
jgi:lipoprotein-anchoring transpeptidase ErfK/SrfK